MRAVTVANHLGTTKKGYLKELIESEGRVDGKFLKWTYPKPPVGLTHSPEPSPFDQVTSM